MLPGNLPLSPIWARITLNLLPFPYYSHTARSQETRLDFSNNLFNGYALQFCANFLRGRFRARKRISRIRKSGPLGLFGCLTHRFEVEETMPAPPPLGRSCQALTPSESGLAVISTGKQVLPGKRMYLFHEHNLIIFLELHNNEIEIVSRFDGT